MTTLAPTISSRYFPHTTGWLRDLFLVVGGTLFVAALAQIRILLPFTPVPITGQTLGVLLVGAALGSKRGASALSLYLVAGAIGLPFFQGGPNGLGIVFGATGGYLIGFIAAAFIIGFLAEHGMDRSIRTSIPTFPGWNSCNLPLRGGLVDNPVSGFYSKSHFLCVSPIPHRRCHQDYTGWFNPSCGLELIKIINMKVPE